MSAGKFDRPDSDDDDAVMVSLWGKAAFINSLWALRSPSPHTIHDTRELIHGVWETTLTRFGEVELTRGQNVLQVSLYRRDETVIRVSQRSGIDAKQIIKVDGINPLTGQLCILMSAEKSWITYDKSSAGALSVEWKDQAAYILWNPFPLEPPERYQTYFEGLKKITVGSVDSEANPSLEKLYIVERFSGGQLVFMISERPLASATVALCSQENSDDQPLANNALVALFRSSKFPEAAAGREPAEARWLYQLVAPRGSMKVVGGEKDAGGWLTEYGKDSKRRAGVSPRTANQNIQTLSPHARIVQAGDEPQRLEFVATPLSSANWTLTGAKRGKLESDSDGYFYVPPISLSPAAVFDESVESLIPAAYRSSFSGLPVVTDVVQVANATQTAMSTFVTTVIPPTHFFRFGIHPDGLELKLWWVTRTGERQVPAERVKWHVLSGNGMVSAQGLFVPATQAPSSVTIVMAEDLSDDSVWLYGIVIVPLPLIAVDDVMRLLE
ncbi:hypothetical protein E6B08_08185 [Pseudomonas putida]|uniref:Uncharacterized protein n=1 Tax=Pseudomonas putida TaxID=303 RepID=A0A4D6X5M5_PSEPU|nr:hypothetical protein [Pseudomonas putida]QCI11377.1 hypothetical protein E6B08_08185 [Pseudomonas putida]